MTNDYTNNTSTQAAAPAFEQAPESKFEAVLKRIGLVLLLIAVKAFVYSMFR
jgi:hypothetical protein